MLLRRLIELNNGIGYLDGYEQVVKENDKERVIRASYELSGGTRLAFARNLNAIKPNIEAYQKVAQESKPEELPKMLDTDIEITLVKINLADLNLEKNNIPSSVISLLSPIISDI